MSIFRKKKDSEYYWKVFCRLRKASEQYAENSEEHWKINQVCWEVIGKYIDALGEEWGER